jgi:hypothetical protein
MNNNMSSTWAMMVGVSALVGAYFAYQYQGKLWAISVAAVGLILALAIAAWPTPNAVGDNCTGDKPCPVEWKGSVSAVIPCNMETGKVEPVADPTTSPCLVKCPAGEVADIVDGVRMCVPSGERDCVSGVYKCVWLENEKRWKALDPSGVEVEGNVDDRGRPLCGGPNLQLPGGWEPNIYDKVLYRDCVNSKWTSYTDYSGFTCDPTKACQKDYACTPCATGEVCSPSSPYSGKLASNCDDTNRCAYLAQGNYGLWGVKYADGACNKGSALCTYPCTPNGKGYSNLAKPSVCRFPPRCLAWAALYRGLSCTFGNTPDNDRYWLYNAFFIMEDRTIRWIGIDSNQNEACRPKILWDASFVQDGAGSNFSLPLSQDNYRQLSNPSRWYSSQLGVYMTVNYKGQLIASDQLNDASNSVFSFSNLPNLGPGAPLTDYQLIVHDNIYGVEAWVDVCQSGKETPPLLGGWRDKSKDWRFKNIPDNKIQK